MSDYNDMTPEELAKARGDYFEPTGDEDPGNHETPPAGGSQQDDDNTPPAAGASADDDKNKGAAGSEEGPPPSGQMETIPKARFDEVNNKRKFLEEQVAAIQAQNELLMEMLQKGGTAADLPGGAAGGQPGGEASAPSQQEDEKWKDFDPDVKIKEYNELVFDGETEEAAKILNELREFDRYTMKKELLSEVQSTLQQRDLQSQVGEGQKVAQEIYENHKDWFDEDEENLEIFIAARERLQKKGLTLAQALRKAEEKFFGKGASSDSTGGQPGAGGGNNDAAAARKEERQRLQNERNAAAMRQPNTQQGGAGNRDVPTKYKNALEIPEDEYAKMSKEEKARLRGDII